MSFHGGFLGVAAGDRAVRPQARLPILALGRRRWRRRRRSACSSGASPTSSTASSGAAVRRPDVPYGDGASRTAGPLAAPSHPALRGRPRRPAAVRRPRARDPPRRACAAGPRLRHLPARLRAGAHLLECFRQADAQLGYRRILGRRARRRHHHGHAAVAADVLVGLASSLRCAAQPGAAARRGRRDPARGRAPRDRSPPTGRSGSTPTWRCASGTRARLLRDPRSARRGGRLHHRAGDQPDVRRADRPLAGAGLATTRAARPLRARRARSGARHADARRAARRRGRCRAFAPPRALWLVETSPALRGAAGGDARRGTRRHWHEPARGAAARAARSSSPTSSSTRCRSARSSAPSAAGASALVGARRGGSPSPWAAAPGRGPRRAASRLRRRRHRRGRAAAEAMAAGLGAGIAGADRRGGAARRLRRLGPASATPCRRCAATPRRPARRAGRRRPDRPCRFRAPRRRRRRPAARGARHAAAGRIPRARSASPRAAGAGARAHAGRRPAHRRRARALDRPARRNGKPVPGSGAADPELPRRPASARDFARWRSSISIDARPRLAPASATASSPARRRLLGHLRGAELRAGLERPARGGAR